MAATAVTGTGPGSADTHNKGSVHNTLGIERIVDLPRYGVLYTAFPADGHWNFLEIVTTVPGETTTGTLGQFYIGFQYGPFYNWDRKYVQSSNLFKEQIVAVNDTLDIIPEISFTTATDATVAPFSYRVLNVTAPFAVNPHFTTIAWNWNDSMFFAQISIHSGF